MDEVFDFRRKYSGFINKEDFIRMELEMLIGNSTTKKIGRKVEINYPAIFELMKDMFYNDVHMFLGKTINCNCTYCYEYITNKLIYSINPSIRYWAPEIATCFVKLYHEMMSG